MVHWRKGVIKAFSPHLVEVFGDENHPKMGWYDMDWIIISFFIHIESFSIEELAHKAILLAGPSFANLGIKLSRRNLRHQMVCFVDKKSSLKFDIFL